MRVTLFVALLGLASAVTHEECSNGDLDFLCRHSDACSMFISDAEASLCASLADHAGSVNPMPPTTSPALPPTPSHQTTGFNAPTDPVTRGVVSRPVTGGTGYFETMKDAETTAFPDVPVETEVPDVPDVTDDDMGNMEGGEDATDDDMGNMEGVTEAYTRGHITGTAGVFQTTDLPEEPSTEAAQPPEPTAPIYAIAPEIITAPRNITVPPGGLARFLCLSKGAPTPQTTITKLDETIEPDKSSFRQTVADRESSISMIQEIENVVEANEGWYRCLSCNYYGCARADGYLRVLDLCTNNNCQAPKVCVADYEAGTHSCECPDYCEGDTRPDFVCSNYCGTYYSPCQMKNEACANARADEAIWMKGYCPMDLTNPKTATLYNEAGDRLDQEITIEEGGSFTITCRAESKPDPDFLWFKKGSTAVVATGAQFTISNAQTSQSGKYFCQARACKSADKAVDSDLVDVVVETRLTTSAPVSSTPAGDGPDNLTFDAPTYQCHVYGDPHFNTFDLNKYDFMGQCDYVLAMDCEAARWFVYGRMRACGNGGSCLESVTLYYNNQIIELMRGWLVNHFGAKVSPKNFKNQPILVGETFNMVFDGRYLHVDFVLETYINEYGQEMAKKVKVVWDGYVSAEISAPQQGRTCGLCGNNNGDPADDFRSRRRGLTESPEEFGDSWKIDRYNRCPETQKQQSNEEICGSNYNKVKRECEDIFNLAQFNDCSKKHDKAAYVEACIYDVCADSQISEDYPPQCAAAGSFAMRCTQNHYFRDDPKTSYAFDVTGWEEAVGCPDKEELYDSILDVGCPQPDAEDDEATRALINLGA